MDRPRNRAASGRADERPAILTVAARIEHDDIRFAEACIDIPPRGKLLRTARANPVGDLRLVGVASRRQAGTGPGPETPIEHTHIGMAEVLEEPERSGGAHPGLFVVHDDRRLFRHAT